MKKLLSILFLLFTILNTNTSYGSFPNAPTSNAGIVIIQAFIPTYFNRLGLTVNGNFVSRDAQNKAVIYLHYLATKENVRNDQALNLEKIICGLPIDASIDLNIEIPQEVIELSDGLIHAVINNWPTSGSSSVTSFQNNWIIRDGFLNETIDGLHLSVEKRSYDLLLEQAPFSFGFIKYSWMPKALTVDWIY